MGREGECLAGDLTVERFKNNRNQIMALGAFNLLESLDVVMLRAIHNRKNLGEEVVFFPGPLTTRTCV